MEHIRAALLLYRKKYSAGIQKVIAPTLPHTPDKHFVLFVVGIFSHDKLTVTAIEGIMNP